MHRVRPSRISKSLKPKLKTWMLDDGDYWDLEVRAQLLHLEDAVLKEKSINKLLICPIFRKCLVTFSDSPRADLVRTRMITIVGADANWKKGCAKDFVAKGIEWGSRGHPLQPKDFTQQGVRKSDASAINKNQLIARNKMLEEQNASLKDALQRVREQYVKLQLAQGGPQDDAEKMLFDFDLMIEDGFCMKFEV